MLTRDIRNQVDRIWNAFWSKGVSNPLTVIEQITHLLFIKRLDGQRRKRAAEMMKVVDERVFSLLA